MKSSPASTPSDGPDTGVLAKRAKSEKLVDIDAKNVSTQPTNNLIMIPLGEVLEIIRLFAASSPSPSCADWASIATQATKGRISANDAEYIANEFIPTVHYRPSMGMVVMERSMRNQVSDFHRHKLTVRRLKQGLPLMVERFKAIFLGEDGVVKPSEEVHIDTEPISTPELVNTEQDEEDERMSIIDSSSQKRLPGRPSNRTIITVSNFDSLAPPEYLAELRSRAQATIQRYQQGEVPLYALKPVNESDAVAAGLTATGRVKRRYETKAIRLAKAAAAVASGDIMETPQPAISSPETITPPVGVSSSSPSFQLHSIFQRTAEQFARSRAASSTSSDPVV